jgi:hypothetical protein
VSEQERLRRLFRELHEDDPPAPEYRSLAAGDGSSHVARPRPGRRVVARAAWAAAAAAAAGAVILALSLRGRPAPAPGEDEMLRLAASLRNWEAPTDFLLTTPGAEFLQSAPRLGTKAETLSGDRTDLLQNDSNEMEVFE